MTDAPTFHDYAQKALTEAMVEAAKPLVAGNFPDFAAYRHAVGVHKGLQIASDAVAETYKTVIEGVKPQKETNAGRKPEDRSW